MFIDAENDILDSILKISLNYPSEPRHRNRYTVNLDRCFCSKWLTFLRVKTKITSGSEDLARNWCAAKRTGQNVEQPESASQFPNKCTPHKGTDEPLVEKVQKGRNSPSGRRLYSLRRWTKSSILFYFVNYNVWIRVS